jgi:16S rRNA (guanine966-N2)-methyltransferase
MVGPNGLRHLEQSMAALSGLGLEPADARRILAAIDDHVRGHPIRETWERRAPGGGVTTAEREAFLRPYIEELIGSDGFENNALLLRGCELEVGDFDQGLAWMLDGIERTHVRRCARAPRPGLRRGGQTEDVTRLIAGAAGGRRISVPSGRDTRPTSDRAREGLFATIHSLLGDLTGLRAADLFAGSGAVGLEALSRGASHALLVESSPKAARVIRANIGALGLPGAELVVDRVERVLRTPPPEPYDLVFADPPYAMAGEAVTAMLEALRDGGWLAPDALVVVERATRGEPLRWPAGYLEDRARRYGEGTLWYGHAAGR